MFGKPWFLICFFCLRQWGGEEEWWAELLQWVMYQGLDMLMVDKVKDELSESSTTQVQSLANRY